MKFIKQPDINYINYIITLYGFKEYNDKTTLISQTQLQLNNITGIIIGNLDDLNTYFERKIKIRDITINKCITIARNFLYLKNLDILRITKNKNGIKTVFYKIGMKNIRKIKATQYKPKVISFYDW